MSAVKKARTCPNEPGDAANELRMLEGELRVLEAALNDDDVPRLTLVLTLGRIQERIAAQANELDEMQDRWSAAMAEEPAPIKLTRKGATA